MIRIVRSGRRCVAGVAATTTIAGVALFGAQSATAATSSSGSPAHAVGNYLDATLGGQPIDAIAKLAYADAKDPGTTSAQNPLDVTALSKIELPLTDKLRLTQLQPLGGAGAIAQKAQAKTNGTSYGQAGTALRQGGVQIGGNDSTDKAGDATLELNGGALGGQVPGADGLGGITLSANGVSAVAEAKGARTTTGYRIADLKLKIGSSALGAVLKQIITANPSTDALTKAINDSPLAEALSGTGLTDALQNLGKNFPELPTLTPAGGTQCALTGAPSTLPLLGGAVRLDTAGGGITVDLSALLDTLGLNLNALPPNTDVIAYLRAYLTNADGLAKGVQAVLGDTLASLDEQFTACKDAFASAFSDTPFASYASQVTDLLGTLNQTLTDQQHQFTAAVTSALNALTSSAPSSPLQQVASGLGKLIDIGANVQENGPAGPPQAPFVSGLDATAKQGTPIEAGTTLVRALEINIAAGAGSQLTPPSLPGLSAVPGAPSLSGVGQGFFSAASGNAGILTVGLANASVRQGVAAAAPRAATAKPAGPAALTPAAEPMPTAVAAGEGTHGTPVTPLILLALGMGMAGAAGIAWKVRGRHA